MVKVYELVLVNGDVITVFLKDNMSHYCISDYVNDGGWVYAEGTDGALYEIWSENIVYGRITELGVDDDERE